VNVAGADTLGSNGTGTAKLITSIKTAINWVLSILGLIALIILLYGGFNMVTAAGDDKKYETGFKILKQAGIGLIFI
jgi:TRAP-type C4-dicarboxylate transport system permease small subunit